MKAFLLKKLISKNGYYDRKLLVFLMKPKSLANMIHRKAYNFMLNLSPEYEPKVIRKLHAMERMAQAFEPIGIVSKIKFKFKKR